MTLWPGDKLVGENGHTYELGPLVAYQGKDDCTNPMCRRIDGTVGCVGYHCPTCDEPCSMMGHKCPQRGEA